MSEASGWSQCFVPVSSCDFAELADDIRLSVADGRPLEKSVLASIRDACISSLGRRPDWIPMAMSATATLAGQIGESLKRHSTPC